MNEEIKATELTTIESKEFSVFASKSDFESAARMALALSQSTIVPKEYQGNTSNCLIALEMSNRLQTSPLMVMQNLYIVQGKPAWSSQYMISIINTCGRFDGPLQFEITGKGDSLSCFAWTTQKGKKVEGPVIDMKMAKAEGWVEKNGSKWKTMPEIMIRYRAASFFGRIYCPDAIMGIYSQEEVYEMKPTTVIEGESALEKRFKAKEIVEGEKADGEVSDTTSTNNNTKQLLFDGK